MSKNKPNVLVIDDEENMLLTYKSILKKKYNTVLVNRGQAGIDKVNEQEFAAVIVDLKMPDMDGLEVLRKIKEINPDQNVVMSTAMNDAKIAIQAIRNGALEYITKPFEIDELVALMDKVMERNNLIKENSYLKTVLQEQKTYFDLIGQTQVMQNIFMTIENISAADSTVLITGESGTGKELVAHAIHNKSNRKARPFVIVNCAAIPENLLESELFGHERGAFTGALERKIGKFELADGGTIFLDEIGCMPLSMQSKLLRIVQDSKISRVGGKNPIEVDVRILAATNANIETEIKKGNFREDLFYRLNVIPIKLPPLRERKNDIPLFVSYFLNKFNRDLKKAIKTISPDAIRSLLEYNWPGNVRELQNLIERAVALNGNKDVIDSIQVSTSSKSEDSKRKKNLKEATAEFEKEYIKSALKTVNGNQSAAARLLEIHRTTLISKMELLGLK
ncbi:sigma-54-dependent transcriptional regulator [Candidatus Margulisiibacteriota bacterium]